MSTNRVRVLFRTAAVFNWSAVALFLPALGLAERLGLSPAPTGTLFEHVGIAAIGLFGVGYWMAGSAPDRQRGVIQLGLAGKVIVVALVLAYYLAGDANLRLTLVISGDAIYAVLFTRYLAKTRVSSSMGSESA